MTTRNTSRASKHCLGGRGRRAVFRGRDLIVPIKLWKINEYLGI